MRSSIGSIRTCFFSDNYDAPHDDTTTPKAHLRKNLFTAKKDFTLPRRLHTPKACLHKIVRAPLCLRQPVRICTTVAQNSSVFAPLLPKTGAVSVHLTKNSGRISPTGANPHHFCLKLIRFRTAFASNRYSFGGSLGTPCHKLRRGSPTGANPHHFSLKLIRFRTTFAPNRCSFGAPCPKPNPPPTNRYIFAPVQLKTHPFPHRFCLKPV